MYFADELMAAVNGRSFEQRVKARELPTCPPESELSPSNNLYDNKRFFSWAAAGSHRVLYEGAVFAVVRWTNVYFPAHFGFFGDWFGGPLRSLFGTGISDVPLEENTPMSTGATWRHHQFAPAVAHSYYFTLPGNGKTKSAAREIRNGMELDAPWIQRLWTGPAMANPTGSETLDRADPLTADAVRSSVS